jgi:hypothetical protein
MLVRRRPVPGAGEQVEKAVFVVFFAGERARTKIGKVRRAPKRGRRCSAASWRAAAGQVWPRVARRLSVRLTRPACPRCLAQICEAFGANRYPLPEEPNRQRAMAAEVRAPVTHAHAWRRCSACGPIHLRPKPRAAMPWANPPAALPHASTHARPAAPGCAHAPSLTCLLRAAAAAAAVQVGGRLTEMKTTLEVGDLQRTRVLKRVADGEPSQGGAAGALGSGAGRGGAGRGGPVRHVLVCTGRPWQRGGWGWGGGGAGACGAAG